MPRISLLFCALLAAFLLAGPKQVYAYSCLQELRRIASPIDRLEGLVRRVIREGHREPYAHIYSEKAGDKEWIRVESPEGSYVFQLDTSRQHAGPSDIARTGGRNVVFEKIPAAIDENYPHIEDIIRSAIRSDPYLSPSQLVPSGDGKMHPSIEQQKAIAALLKFEEERIPGKSLRVGVITSTGVGKTFLAIEYAKELGRKLHNSSDPELSKKWKKSPKILFIVENNEILTDAVNSNHRQTGLHRSLVTELYDGRTTGRIDPHTQFIAATRSSLHSRIEEIKHLLTADPEQPWVIVTDEGHHTGKEKGQFEEIEKELATVLDDRHRELDQTATPWHQDKDLVRRRLKGRVYGMLLDDEENAQLRAGNGVMDLARRQLVRAIRSGALSPPEKISITRYLDKNKDFPATRYLNQWTLDATGKEVPVVHEPLLRHAANQLLASRKPGIVERGVIFVPSVAHANLYAPILSKMLGAKVVPYHRGEDAAKAGIEGAIGVQEDAVRWMRDEGEHAGSASEDKYIIVVNILNEGVNIPGLNRGMVLKNYGEGASGWRSFLQNFGRLTRLAGTAKRGFEFFDYSGMSRLLKEDLKYILPGSSRHDPGTDSGPKRITVDDEELDPDAFEENYFRLFDEKDTKYELAHDPVRIFGTAEGALEVLSGLAMEQNSRFGTDGGYERICRLIVSKLPESPEKNALLEEMTEWGFSPRDGSLARNPKRGDHLQARTRGYKTLLRAAEIWNKTKPADKPSIDTRALYEIEGAAKLVDALGLKWKSLSPEQVTQFGEKEGALGVFEGISREKNRAISFGYEHACREIVSALKTSKKDALLNEMKGWGFTELDGNAARGPQPAKHTQPRNRGHRTLVRAAEIWNEIRGSRDPAIDITRLHEKAEAGKLLDALGIRWESAHLTPEQMAYFAGPEGALEVLQGIAKQGHFAFGTSGGYEKACNAIVAKLPESADKTALLGEMKEWGFVDTDGNRVKNTDPAIHSQPRIRGNRLLLRAVEIWNKTKPAGKLLVDTNALYTKDGAAKLIDALEIKWHAPQLTPQQLHRFGASDGALQVLAGIAKEKRWAFGQKNGYEKVCRELASKLPDPQKTELLKEMESWKFTHRDGHLVKSKDRARHSQARNRGYRALVEVAEVWNETKAAHEPYIDIGKLDKKEEAAKLAEILGLRWQSPRLSKEQVERFGSVDGAWQVFEGIAQLNGWHLSTDDSFEKICRAVVEKLPPGPEKTELETEMSEWGFVKGDGTSIQRPRPKDHTQPRNRGYKTLLRAAEVWNQTKPAGKPAVKIDALYEKEGAAALMDALEIQWRS